MVSHMKLGDLLSSRAKQRLILSARAMDKSRERSQEFIDAELSILDDPTSTTVEMCTGVVSAIGHRTMEIPTSFVAGAEEFFRRR